MRISSLTQTITGSLALLTSLLLLTPNAGHAGALTPGNLVVVQVGTGSAALAGTGTAAFLNEYTTAGAVVQQIALPTTTVGANVACLLSGTATSEGFISLSTNGQYLVVAGYNNTLGATVTSQVGNRTVARIDKSGNVDTTTVLNDAASIGNSRSVTTDNGANIWVASSSGGMRYTTFGSTSASTQLNSAAPTNLRVANIFANQLYVDSASGSFFGVGTLGTGLPTTSGQTPALLSGMPAATGHSPYGFWFKDANTVYVADDGSVTTAGGGIQKWTLSGGTWSLAYNVVNTIGCRGLTGTVDDNGNAVLFATTSASAANTLIKVTDTGAGATVTVLATAPANTAFRGVAFGPVPSLLLSATALPAAGPLTKGATAVPVFGFQLSPTAITAGFTTLALTTAGTATASDLSNFRVVEDVGVIGTYEPGIDTIVSGAGQSLASTINFTITGEGSFTAPKKFLVIADVSATATSGATFTGSIAAGGAGTTPAAGGSATGNRQTIGIDMTLSAVAASESATLSSLLNDAAPLTSTSGAQVWQVLFNNPAGNAGAGTISAMTFSQGAGNQMANWTNAIQAADLFDGATHLASGTINPTTIAFSGLSLVVADGASKTLSLRISLKSTPTLTDNAGLQFALAAADVASSGNGLVTASPITSDSTQNKITVVATKLAFTSPNSSSAFFAIINNAFNGIVQAQDANGNLDLDSSVGVNVIKASGPGTFTEIGGDALALHGVASWLTTASSGFTFDTVGDYTLTALDEGGVLTAATSGTITVENPATLAAEVVMPQYMEGGNSGGTNRLPFAYCVTLGSLVPNATYRYYNECVVSTDAATTDGAGNFIIASPSGSFVWVNSSTASFSTPGTYGTFTTDGSGSYTGWFVAEPTGNATRFATPGTQVFMQIMLNNGADGTFVLHRVRSTTPVTILPFGTDSASGTAIYGTSYAKAKNFVVLYDNTAGTGRPLAATFIEDDGEMGTSYVPFYTTSVNGIPGAWGTIIPNNNANGVRRIEERALAGGSVVLASTDVDGSWPSGASTVNPLAGWATPIAIATTDAPLGTAPVVPHITNIQVSGTSVLIDFTGGTSDTISDFTAVSTTDLTTAMTPVAAVFSTSAPGVFRATVTSSAPAAFYRIKR